MDTLRDEGAAENFGYPKLYSSQAQMQRDIPESYRLSLTSPQLNIWGLKDSPFSQPSLRRHHYPACSQSGSQDLIAVSLSAPNKYGA
jgi:hypothetical protein